MRISPKHIMGISPTSLTSAYLEIKYLMRRQSSMERGKSYMFVLFRLLGCYTVFILGTIWSNVWIVFGKISALVTSYFLCLLTGRESREERRWDEGRRRIFLITSCLFSQLIPPPTPPIPPLSSSLPALALPCFRL